MRGLFVAFEGPDGSGKSTVASEVAGQLDRAGHRVILTREPGGTEMGKGIRHLLLERNLDRDPVTELLLMCADRAEHVRTVIRPALVQGICVISDRYAGSTRAYQGAGLGIDHEIVARSIEIATGDLEPDLTILLDLPVEEAIDRLHQRFGEQNDIDRRSVEFHVRVRKGFLEQARACPESWLVLDASQPVDDVVEGSRKAIEAAMRLSRT